MSAPRLQLYTRPGCHLCEDLLAAAAPIAERHGAAIEKVDIDGDERLAHRYGLAIPVLALGGREICRHRLDADALERALAEASGGAGC